MSDTETINPYLKKEMYNLMNQPIVPTDELKRIIGYQDVILTTFQEVNMPSDRPKIGMIDEWLSEEEWRNIFNESNG